VTFTFCLFSDRADFFHHIAGFVFWGASKA
jgi:hypothetical protein